MSSWRAASNRSAAAARRPTSSSGSATVPRTSQAARVIDVKLDVMAKPWSFVASGIRRTNDPAHCACSS